MFAKDLETINQKRSMLTPVQVMLTQEALESLGRASLSQYILTNRQFS